VGARGFEEGGLRLDFGDGLEEVFGVTGEDLFLLAVEEAEEFAVILEFVAEGGDEVLEWGGHGVCIGQGSGGGMGRRGGCRRLGLEVEFVAEFVGQAEHAGAADVVGEGFIDEVVVDAVDDGGWAERGLEDGFPGFGEDLAEEQGFELSGGLGDFFFWIQVGVAGDLFEGQAAGVGSWLGGGEGPGYWRTSSAWRAPACFMAMKMDMVSRGVTPRELRAAATFSTVGISGRGMRALFSSDAWVSVLGVTTVRPV
jgi:hypothetical protein